MVDSNVIDMRKKHEVLAELKYDLSELYHGYTNKVLQVNISEKTISIEPVTEQMKDLWIGGKGFALWLMFQKINSETKWDSPDNPICFSSGPLGGSASFPGSGKTLVTSLSPLTQSIIDSNVGGYFGPYLKFAGFDALCLTGKGSDETILCIDAANSRITLEKAPVENVDSHLAAEEFTEMYADDEVDKQNIAVVSAGSAADHVRMGVLNFSFYDWRRQVPRLKQAGRGGIGTVFRNKKMKAIIVKNKSYSPAWWIEKSKVQQNVIPETLDFKQPDPKTIQTIIRKWHCDPEYVIEMMQDVQKQDRFISVTAIEQINRDTGVPKSELYHIATFYKAFSLEPKGEMIVQVCVGTACHVKGSGQILDALERELSIKSGETTRDGKFSLEAVACLGCCSLAPVVKIGEEIYGNMKIKDVASILKGKRG